MAMKKRGRPKSKKTTKFTHALATGTKKKRGRPKGSKVVHIAKPHSVAAEIGLLQRIDKKVTRIDRTVNSGFHLARKAKKNAHRNVLSGAYEEAERSGELYE